MRARSLVVLSFNTHVGIALRNGATAWLLRRVRPDVVLIQEGRADALHRVFPPSLWHYHVEEQPQERQGTYVLARRDRFERLGAGNRDVTFGEQYPRRLAVMRLLDRRTGREVVASSIHVAPLGNGFEDANPHARDRHERQVQAYADRFERVGEHKVAIVGGDVNERLSDVRRLRRGPLRHRHVIARLRRTAELVPAFVETEQHAGLDDVFFRPRPFVRLVRRRTLRPPFPGVDHPAIVVRFRVRPRRP